MPQVDNSGPLIIFHDWPGAANKDGDPDAAGETGRAALLDDLRTREQKERAAAKQATSLAARRAHQELAQLYARVLRNGLGSQSQ
jgi:hypothetical protein